MNNVAALFGLAGVMNGQREFVQYFFGWNAIQMVGLRRTPFMFVRAVLGEVWRMKKLQDQPTVYKAFDALKQYIAAKGPVSHANLLYGHALA